MSKGKNHTNHNQNRKQHRNGIHKVRRLPFRSTKGVRNLLMALVPLLRRWRRTQRLFKRLTLPILLFAFLCRPLQMDPKFLLNQRYAKKYAKIVGGRAAAEAAVEKK